MRKDLRRLLGAGITVFSLLLFFNVISLAALMTINYIDIWDYLYPGSTDSSDPDMVTAGSTVTLTARLLFQDDSIGWYSDPNGWTVQVEISTGGSTVATVTLTLTSMDEGIGLSEWQGSWAVPDGEDVLYTLTWNVETPDSGSANKTTYAKTPLIEPDGVFQVNGKDAAETTVQTVISPTLSFTFTPSQAASKITAVKVEIWKDDALQSTVTLTKEGDTYTGTYTLPSPGTYELKGFIEWSGGSPLRKMSVLATWNRGGEEGGEEGGEPLRFGLNQIVGLLGMAAGLALIVSKKS